VTASLKVPRGLQAVLAPNLRVVFCGINPGLRAALLGHHFAGSENRFWKTIDRAGFTRREISPENDVSILVYGYGLTSRADELSRDEFERGLGLVSKDCTLLTGICRVSRKSGLLGDL
jgi:double-stranded uracil-DNA glycosylase